ncbi:hypothetical protein P5609_001400 [Bacillus licheniformis]|uniref:hypothetical protein n=1 Tax=Bacillus licheniformis TaxID=1402 RepID=UPI00018C805A|nr:hypothetical protein [Bacillus licheniformis]MDH3162345.1 hypothetical protein [Bacillus licheniformis]MED4409031.1 hypothetical protein [Bacillus licheniformis]QDL76915.1 hypothetical protein D9Y32_05310 [Bacillus licheniformis]
MFDYYEFDSKLIVRLKRSYDIDSLGVKTAIEELLKETNAVQAVVSNHERTIHKTFENEDKIDFESMMISAPPLGGHSRKSRAINSQEIGNK